MHARIKYNNNCEIWILNGILCNMANPPGKYDLISIYTNVTLTISQCSNGKDKHEEI